MTTEDKKDDSVASGAVATEGSVEVKRSFTETSGVRIPPRPPKLIPSFERDCLVKTRVTARLRSGVTQLLN
jgi:hypothetical protein